MIPCPSPLGTPMFAPYGKIHSWDTAFHLFKNKREREKFGARCLVLSSLQKEFHPHQVLLVTMLLRFMTFAKNVYELYAGVI
jgi:hypothetical protein